MAAIFSIIIPHHNIPSLLHRCLTSIPETEDIEVIIVDDNSDPNKVDFNNIVHNIRKNCKIIRTYLGKGAGYARNIGLQQATGKWVIFSDADDYFTQNAFDVFRKNIDDPADMIIFKADSVDSNTLEPAKRSEKINIVVERCLNNTGNIKENVLSFHAPWGRMIKKSFIDNNNLSFDEVIASNDTMFTTRVSCLTDKISFSDEKVYVITYRQGSLWDNKNTNPTNFLVRLEVQIARNKYVSQFGYSKTPIIGQVFKAYQFGLRYFFTALWMAIRSRAIFDGLREYID